MTKQKKPKTGDVVGWYVVDPKYPGLAYECVGRSDARATLGMLKLDKSKKHYRLAKMVLAK